MVFRWWNTRFFSFSLPNFLFFAMASAQRSGSPAFGRDEIIFQDQNQLRDTTKPILPAESPKVGVQPVVGCVLTLQTELVYKISAL
jgi:hypothetical protein